MGEAEGLAVLALEQTAGRGRYGRVWRSAPGSLNLSLLLRPARGLADGIGVSLLMAVELHEAVRATRRSGAGLMVKWPNDVLLDDGKLAGILIEGGGGASPFLVVGVGVNLGAAPELAERRTSFVDAAAEPEAFATRLLAQLDGALQAFATEGLEPVRQAWLRVAHPVGTALHVSLPDGTTLEGGFAGLADDGALLLDHAGATLTVRAGDVLLA